MAFKSLYHGPMEQSFPKFADQSKYHEVEELETMGVLSRTVLDQDESPAFTEADHNLDFSHSRVFNAISMEELAAKSGGPESSCLCGDDSDEGYADFARGVHPGVGTSEYGYSHDLTESEAPLPNISEVRQAIDTECQMTVYDPEVLNETMAPRTNSFQIRKRILTASFIKDLDHMEKKELEQFIEILRKFHESRRRAMGLLNKSGCLETCTAQCRTN